MVYDVIIVGNGPAGISAALYAKRGGLSVLIISKDNSNLLKAEQIGNYYGFENPIPGKELYNKGINQAKNLGIEIVEDEVISINFNKDFEVIATNNTYFSKTVILATGSSRKEPNIKGIKEFEGKGVSYCAICDAFFYRNKNVAVIGNGNYAIHEIMQLKPVVNSVVMLTDGERPIENRSIPIEIEEKKIKEVRGTNKVEELEFEDNSKKKIDGLFIAIGTASSDDLARKIGALVENNKIVVNDKMQTTVPGLFACGDCTGGLLQISKAVHEGTVAGLETIKYIKKKGE